MKISLKIILNTILAYIMAIFALTMPCEPNNVTLTFEPVTTESTSVIFTYKNETNRTLLNDVKLSSFEKKIDGEWVKMPFTADIKPAAYRRIHTSSTLKRININSYFGVDFLEAGEYRVTVVYEISDLTENKILNGETSATFTVTEAE